MPAVARKPPKAHASAAPAPPRSSFCLLCPFPFSASVSLSTLKSQLSTNHLAYIAVQHFHQIRQRIKKLCLGPAEEWKRVLPPAEEHARREMPAHQLMLVNQDASEALRF